MAVATPVSPPLVVAVIQYVPGEPTTVNVPVRTPPAMLQLEADTGLPVKEQKVSGGVE